MNNIQQQIIEKQKQITSLQYDIDNLQRSYFEELVKPLRNMYLHKYIKLNSGAVAYITDVYLDIAKCILVDIGQGDKFDDVEFYLMENQKISFNDIDDFITKQDFMDSINSFQNMILSKCM